MPRVAWNVYEVSALLQHFYTWMCYRNCRIRWKRRISFTCKRKNLLKSVTFPQHNQVIWSVEKVSNKCQRSVRFPSTCVPHQILITLYHAIAHWSWSKYWPVGTVLVEHCIVLLPVCTLIHIAEVSLASVATVQPVLHSAANTIMSKWFNRQVRN